MGILQIPFCGLKIMYFAGFLVELAQDLYMSFFEPE